MVAEPQLIIGQQNSSGLPLEFTFTMPQLELREELLRLVPGTRLLELVETFLKTRDDWALTLGWSWAHVHLG